jgi:2TM domain
MQVQWPPGEFLVIIKTETLPISPSSRAMPESNLATYTPADIQEILNLALTKQSANGELEFSHEQLVEIAAEMNIDPSTLQSAELDWSKQNGLSKQQQEFDRHRRQQFINTLARYGIVNTALVGVNLLVLGGTSFLWSAYILLFWGAGVALKGWQLTQLQGEEYERKLQNWNSKRKIRQSVHSIISKVLP